MSRVSSIQAMVLSGLLMVPTLSMAQWNDTTPNFEEGLGQAAFEANSRANAAGQEALENAALAATPVIYAGKAVLNGAEFLLFKTEAGLIIVAQAAVSGAEFLVEGARFLAIKTVDGVIYVAEAAIQAGKVLADLAVTGLTVVVDGVTYVAVELANGVVFLTRTAVETALRIGEIVIDGVTYIVEGTVESIVLIAKATGKLVVRVLENAQMLAHRARVMTSLRSRIGGALGSGGNVGETNLEYFRRHSTDSDPKIARLASSCLAAAEMFNSTY